MPDDDTTSDAEPQGKAPEPSTTSRQAPQADTDWEQEARKWKTLSRQHEQSWQRATRENDGLKQQVSERDVAMNDLSSNTAGDLALARLEARLARAGMDESQVELYVKYLDRGRLVKDGKPDNDAIAALVADVPQSLRAPAPDPDQGKTGGKPPVDMNSLIRQAAGR